MGNFSSCRPSSGPGGKLVLSNGTVQEFDDSISVAELMLEHPQHFVVELHSLPTAGTKPTPLPADHKLDTNKLYMLVPMAGGKTAALSMDEVRRILSTSRSALRSRSLPFLSTMCMVGVTRREKRVASVRKGKEGLVEEVRKNKDELEWSPEILYERPEFLSRQFSSKGWKPSLGTIEERASDRKVGHWLF